MTNDNFLPAIIQSEMVSSGASADVFTAVQSKYPFSDSFGMLVKYGLEYGMDKAVNLAKRSLDQWKAKRGTLTEKENELSEKLITSLQTYGSDQQVSFVDETTPRLIDRTLMSSYRCLSQYVGGDIKAVKRFLAAVKVLSEPGAMATVEQILYLKEV